MFGGVILAAGASTRLGQPKALVPVDGEAAVARVARVLKEAGGVDTVVVTGADAPRVQTATPSFARAIHNADWSRGQTSSVQAGLRAQAKENDVVVWPVDRPLVAAATLAALLRARGDIRVPSESGRRGHPTFFARTLRDEILSLAPDQPLHDVLHSKPQRVVEVPVNDPAIHLNIDTPEDLERLQRLKGARNARPLA